MKFFSRIVCIFFLSFLGLTGVSYGQHSSKLSAIKELIGDETLEKFFLLKQIEDQNCLPHEVNNHVVPHLFPFPPSYLGDLKTTEEGKHEFIQIHLPGLEEGEEAWLELGKDGVVWISAAIENGKVLELGSGPAQKHCQKKSEEMRLKDLALPQYQDLDRLGKKFEVMGKFQAQIFPHLIGGWFWSHTGGLGNLVNYYNGGLWRIGNPDSKVMCVVPLASLR